MATIRNSAEDFDVTEEIDFTPSGDGEHDFLYVQKTGINTEWLSRQLADFAGVAAKDVGYSGLKDRHAVTRQWFSVPRWKQPDWSTFKLDGVSLLAVERNARKLRRGAHRSNRFRIVLRGDIAAPDLVEPRLSAIRDQGVPNYFGEQRFGRNAGNIELANAWANSKRLPRHKRSLAISTARSYLFNELLAERVVNNTWNTLVAGDFANLDGSGSVFSVEAVDEELHARCEALDIHPTEVLWGDGCDAGNAPAGHERWINALVRARVQPARRSLRLAVRDLQWEFGDASLTLSFALSRGAFATSVLRELADC